jgi:hypothetical protein
MGGAVCDENKNSINSLVPIIIGIKSWYLSGDFSGLVEVEGL